MSVPCVCCVLSVRGLYDGSITRPEEPYRVWHVLRVISEKRETRTRTTKDADMTGSGAAGNRLHLKLPVSALTNK